MDLQFELLSHWIDRLTGTMEKLEESVRKMSGNGKTIRVLSSGLRPGLNKPGVGSDVPLAVAGISMVEPPPSTSRLYRKEKTGASNLNQMLNQRLQRAHLGHAWT